MSKFEKVKRYEESEEEFALPKRSTKYSAGYDFFAPENRYVNGTGVSYVPTGVKVKLAEDEFLLLCNRSSNPGKKELVLMNGVGIIDSDYYGNEENDGEIAFAFMSTNPAGSFIEKGEKIGQGIIMKFNKTEDDTAESDGTERSGGFGSTGE